jgi:hypothetical protein
MLQPTIHQMREESFIEEKSRKTKRFNIHTALNHKFALLVHISGYPLIENYPQSNSYLCIKIKAQKVHLFRPSLGFLAEADPRLENRRGQKVLFGRGAHNVFRVHVGKNFEKRLNCKF